MLTKHLAAEMGPIGALRSDRTLSHGVEVVNDDRTRLLDQLGELIGAAIQRRQDVVGTVRQGHRSSLSRGTDPAPAPGLPRPILATQLRMLS